MQALSLYARRAGITLLKATPAIAAVVADRVYPQQKPANVKWPFVGWGVMIDAPFDASCMTGAESDFAISCYATTDGTGADTVMGEDRAAELAALIVSTLTSAGDILLPSPTPATAHFTWLQTQVIQNGKEADAFRALISMRVNIVSQ